MPNLRDKTWTETTPAKTEDANFWENHMYSDADAAFVSELRTGGGAGHQILNEDGVEMPKQKKLQFKNAIVSNDATGGITIVDAKGTKGDAATISIGTVTTGAPGTDATVTNSGTVSDAVFNFTIPRGSDGEGAVDTVNNVQPADGNVTLTASNINTSGDVSIESALATKAPSVSPTLKFAIKNGADGSTNPHAEFRTMGSSPSKSVGFAVYDENGTGNYYDLIKGDGTRHFATVPEVNELANALYYKSGDTFATTSYVNAGGMITYGNRNIIVTVPVDKLLTKISSITVTRLTGSMRGIGGYINGATSNDYDWTSNATISATKVTERLVRLTISNSNAFTDATVNTPVTFYGNITLSFS